MASSTLTKEVTKDARVRILDDTVVNQIAAGEVVERPASVVKELVENALDADATEVSVIVGNGGRSSIEVIDNGKGMRREDALLAIERFGTSKIQSTEDLEGVGTLGFRGEALPSIASVSKFRLQTKAREAEGVEVSIRGGKLSDVVERDLPQGTRIRVANLFFNVPARKKFLRTANTEVGHIRALLADFAAAYPERRFSLVSEGQEIECYPPAQGFVERVKELRLLQGKGIEVRFEQVLDDERILVQGMLSQAIESISSSAKLRLLVNGRSVRDRLLLRAIREGYGSFLKPGKYPAGVLMLSVPPQSVDVNVHPQKSEVRFREPQRVFAAVSLAIAKSIESHSLLPDAQSSTGAAARAPAQEREQLRAPFRPSSTRAYPSQSARATFEPEFIVASEDPTLAPSSSSESDTSSPLSDVGATTATKQSTEESILPPAANSTAALHDARYLGQVMNLYLLFETSSELLIVDMHAAHERVMFYKLKSQYLEGSVATQGLLVPETIELAAGESARFDEIAPSLALLGLECERFGEDTILVRAVPAVLGNVSAKTLLQEILSVPEWGSANVVLERAVDASLARLACHRSVRSGRQLNAEEAYSLVSILEEAESASFCPHGRPVIVRYSETQLEALFGRTQF